MNCDRHTLATSVVFILFTALFLIAQDKPGQASGSGSGHGAPAITVLVNGVREPVYRLAQGIKPPRPIDNPQPEYSQEARRERVEGVVTLGLVVTSAGNVTLIRVLKSLGHGLDEKAIEAVRRWKFNPATKDGTPVSVEVAVETSFHLYQRH